MKLKIHSIVDLITNSSTVIFTYSEGSLPALKELVNEMLKTFGKTETFDDVFYAEVFLEEDYDYIEFYENLEKVESYEPIDAAYIGKMKHHILTGEIPKPQWMLDAEGAEDNYNYYRHDTVLEIVPKDEKYKELAKLLLKYLYSTDHEATRDS